MIQFSKYQGLGNDFILIDGRSGQLPDVVVSPEKNWVVQLCDRRFGVGADGLILALPAQAEGDLRMRIFNADGSEAEMCGNGIRCLALFLADSDGSIAGQSWSIETMAGLICPRLEDDGNILVDMGCPFLDPGAIPTTLAMGGSGLPQGEFNIDGTILMAAAVGMGNPHVVVPVKNLQSIPFNVWGPWLEQHQAFPSKTNVHFLEVKTPEQLEIKVWERGAGPTLACGTGACATLVAANLLGLCNQYAEVRLPGGPLQINWPERNGSVFMSGPAVALFDGILTPELTPYSTEKTVQPIGNDVGEHDVGEQNVDNQQETTIKEDVLETEQAISTSEREAIIGVNDFLANQSLDSLIKIAGDSLEKRTRKRLENDGLS